MPVNHKLFGKWIIILIFVGIFAGCNQKSTSPNSLQSLLPDETSATNSVHRQQRSASPTGESLSKWPNDAVHIVRGDILSVDAKAQKVTIRELTTGNSITTRVSDPSTLGSFVQGDRVDITFASMDTSTATSIIAAENVGQ
ncbi:MAG: hypothetical protein KBD53_10115 [Candidatus Omnitrophica bacterium]|nr:hypothetical protein [Candidatus Omnitrophota bacterium]